MKLLRKKLLIIVPSLSLGGAERVASNIAKHYDECGNKVAVISWVDTEDFFELPDSIERFKLKSHKCNVISRNWKRIMFIRQVIKKFKPDFTLSILSDQSVILGFSRIGMPGVFIGTEHSHPPFFKENFIRFGLRWISYGLLDAIVSLTEETAQWHKNNTLAKISVAIPNALTIPIPNGVPIIPVSEYKSTDEVIILAVGRLSFVKGFDLLIEALSKLDNTDCPWRCVILGEGPMRKELEDIVKQLNLENRVFLPGRAGNLKDWYSSSSLLLCTSRVEGFSNVIIEAMSCGLACVSFDCDTGPRSIIENGVNGVLVPNGDGDALVVAINSLLKNDSLRNFYSKNGLSVLTRYSKENVFSMWNSLLETLLKK